MLRKVRSLEWFEKNAVKDVSLAYWMNSKCIGYNLIKGMLKYCEKEIELTEYMVFDKYVFEEWMLEPLEDTQENPDKCEYIEIGTLSVGKVGMSIDFTHEFTRNILDIVGKGNFKIYIKKET